MFKFLKNRIKSGVEKITQLIERDSIKDVNIDKSHEGLETRDSIFVDTNLEAVKKEAGDNKNVLKNIKDKILTTKIDDKRFDNLFSDLEIGLLENNVALEVVERLKQDMRNRITDKQIPRFKIRETITLALRDSISDLLEFNKLDILELARSKKPYVICFVGINGSGKTTTIAKIGKLFKEDGLSVVISASDTFRAASIEQLEKHGNILGIRIIKHKYGADPSAVAFDAIQHAKAKNIDVVLVDTAGRMHSNVNLVNELRKLMRVAKPDIKIFIGESITGNDCIEQARVFNEAICIDGIILTKADVDDKGGTALSIEYVIKKPILFLGTGQDYTDLKSFDKEVILAGLEI